MAIVVQKFGGSSLADVASIKRAASFVQVELIKKNSVVVVVSAMYGVTDELCSYVDAFSVPWDSFDFRERDVVLSSGEQISAGLFALALRSMGVNSKSLMGWQVPVITNGVFSDSFIEGIGIDNIVALLEKGCVPVITGFQGVGKDGDVTTLQRGGSDTSAVAIAVALNAIRCDIYTDVDGVYTSDPSVLSGTVHVPSLSYEEMLEISLYAKILDNRSVEIAYHNSMPVRVLSSFAGCYGGSTYISDSHFANSNHKFNIVNVSSSGLCIGLRIAFSDISALSKLHIPFNLVLVKDSDIFVVCAYEHKSEIVDFIKDASDVDMNVMYEVVVLTLVGSRMRPKNFLIFTEIIELFKENFICINYAIISEIKISIVIDHVHSDLALMLLHDFCLKGIDKNVDLEI